MGMGNQMGRNVFHHRPVPPLVLESGPEAARREHLRITTHNPAGNEDTIIGTECQGYITSVLTQNLEEQLHCLLCMIIVLRCEDLGRGQGFGLRPSQLS